MFDMVKHGPAIWSLMGLKFSKSEMDTTARALVGMDAPTLAAVLGLDSAAVLAILDPAAAQSAADMEQDTAPVSAYLPALGSVWTLSWCKDVFRHTSGVGYVFGPAQGIEGTRRQVVLRTRAQVVDVQAGQVLLLLLSDYSEGMLVRADLDFFARAFVGGEWVEVPA